MILRIIVRRLFFLVFVLFGLSVITFGLSHIIPADPARLMAGPRASKETVDLLREKYGFNDPLLTQYVRYVGDVVRLDFGDSTSSRRSVNEDLRQYLPATIELALAAFMLSVVVGIPLGVLSAVNPNSIWDLIGRLVSITGLAMPSFWLALMLQFAFFAKLGWLPDGQRLPIGVDAPRQITSLYSIDALLAGNLSLFWTVIKHLLMPSVVLAYGSLAVVTRMVRSGMLEVLSQDYVRTARAKGLRQRTVVIRHALKNALLPTITVLGLQVGLLLSGAVLVEIVFSWPGIGRYAVQGVQQFDYNAIMGTTLVIAFVYVIMNLVVDVLYVVVDPRISYA
ncbi:MAG: peptide ABC transporter permease [Chloroflexi bacterium]|nr:MAG: peptide ABC transporter permease [Chloroflexota bacterium]